MQDFSLKMHHIQFSAGALSQTTPGSSQRSPRPPRRICGKGKRKKEERKKERKEKGRRGKGEGKKEGKRERGKGRGEEGRKKGKEEGQREGEWVEGGIKGGKGREGKSRRRRARGMVTLLHIKSNQNQIDRFAMAPHYHSSAAPNTMTLNRDKNEHRLLNKSENKKRKKTKPEQGVWNMGW